ncbi:hypothetical protein BC937DRAFT_89713 [Endogone sp. FLAS-F59071]|nr:hypothetical protein BC937DRAFT_89713 [Endogone sp. FLAS-F59071]|eukprot:RUS17618.1 hypothetical protein BC937DRAFT_89713 [Endogone sp. FLAS-F59071]
MFTTQNKSHFNLKLQGIELPGTHKPGQTGIWRNVANIDELSLFPSPDVTTLYEVFENCEMPHLNGCLKQSAKQPYLGHRPYDPVTETYGDYTWQTYEKIAERRTNFGSGLLHLNEQVIKRNETERWTVVLIIFDYYDTRCHREQQISVALYETLGPDTIEFVTNHAELRLIIASSEQIPKILGMANKLTNLNVIISMDPLSSGKKPAIGRLATDQALKGWANEKGIVLLEFEEVENLGKEHPKPHKPPKPDDVFTISYTSGTTGDPKGAMISHKNMVVAASAGKSTWPFYNTDITISYLPLAHLYGRIVDWITTLYAARIGYYRGDVLLLVDDVGVLRPTIFPTVPRLLNKIYARLKAATVAFSLLIFRQLDAPGVVGHLARAGYAAKLTNLIAGRGAAHLVWDRLIFNKVTQVLGGNLRTLFTASAPISPEVLQFLRVVFSIEICEGWL